MDREGDILKEELRQLEAERNSYQNMLQESKDERYQTLVDQKNEEIKLKREAIEEHNRTTKKGLDAETEIWREGLSKQVSTITGKSWEFKDAGNGLVQAFANGEKVGKPVAKSQMDSIVNSVVQVTKSKTGAMFNAGQLLVDSLAQGESKVSPKAIEMIDKVAQSLPSIIMNQGGRMYSAGYSAMTSLRDGISAAAVNVINSVSSVMSSIAGFGVEFSTSGSARYYGNAMASGGYVDGATRALVGEAGKEVVLPLENNTGNWSGLLANAIMEQMGVMPYGSPINVYMNNTIDNDMSIDEVGRKFSQSIRRYA